MSDSSPIAVDFVSSHARMGGSERYLERVMEGLGPSWVRSITVLEDGPAVAALAHAAGREAQVVPTGSGARSLLESGRRLRSIVRASGPGVIHANGVKAAAVAGLATGRNHPMVWIKHDVAQPGAVGTWAATRSKAIVGVSAFVLSTLPPRARSKAQVLHFGLDDHPVDRPAGRRRLAEVADRDGPFVALVGRIDPGKGHLDALEAWASVQPLLPPGATLVFVGDIEAAHPKHRGVLESRAMALGITADVVFTGQQARADELIAGADIVVMPSRAQANGLGAEGLPLVALEALHAGVPVVGYDAGGMSEAVGPCGLLVAPGDTAALGNALVDLLADPAAATEVGAGGPDRIRESFSYPALLDGLRSIYREAAR